MPLPLHKEKYSYKDYLEWSDGERWELLDGIAYNMSPAPSRKHQDISRELLTVFNNYLKGKVCKVYGAPFDVRLAETDDETDDEIITVVQPDLAVICDASKLDARGCKGAPDLIIEILSPSTMEKDMREKFYLYERFGVKEYWIVHPEDNTVMVFVLNESGQYGKPAFYFQKDKIMTGFPEGPEINLESVFE